ncbi:MAG: phosphate signaling complex protein PhoU [Desulfovibrionaceae bacterium]
MIETHIIALKSRVIKYASLIDTMLFKTFEETNQQDWNSLIDIRITLREKSDAMRLEIAQECVALTALFHPEAGHLRSIMKMSGIIVDLKRMADVICKISSIFSNAREAIPFDSYPQLADMLKETRRMIHDVMQAFSEEDALLAVSVINYDDRVDALCGSLLRKILRKIKEQGEDIDPLIQLLTSIRYLERLADHVTHIAEDVIFIKEGLMLQKVEDLQKIILTRNIKGS